MIVAIDPGNTQSAFVAVPDGELNPQHGQFDILPNDDLREWLYNHLTEGDQVCIEQVRSYGMPVGAEVFDTVEWSGRFCEVAFSLGAEVTMLPRMAVKMHLCHTASAKDANIRQELLNRFGGKGVKASPGWFYGFKADIWAAYALLVTYTERPACA